MTSLTEMHDPDIRDRTLDADGPARVTARRGRVWRGPRPEQAPHLRGRVCDLALVSAAASIALGALTIARLDDGPDVSAVSALGSLTAVADQVRASDAWAMGATGRGVTVAVIDTGVASVPELDGKLVASIDLSHEAGGPEAGVDTYGHGTHMAGIIAGRSPGVGLSAADPDAFVGIAPDASIVSVKVAGRDGAVGTAQLIAGLEWVVEHADEHAIDVVTLAFDGGGAESYLADPLSAAVERAWHAGIVVVAAAGNSGAASDGLGSPAHDPYVIAVGGVEATPTGFTVPDWASSGDGTRNPDVVAPGAHLRSLRAPGSTADTEHPEGYVDDQLFLGSGSSQAAAVVAGAAALLLSEDPSLSPDQVKQALVDAARPLLAPDARVGAGLIDVAAALDQTPGSRRQDWPRSTAVLPAVTFETSADGSVESWWMGASWMGASWMGASWMGASWMGASWMGASWMGASWMGASWMGASWMGASWMGASWMGASWMGASWMGASWMGASRMGASWM